MKLLLSFLIIVISLACSDNNSQKSQLGLLNMYDGDAEVSYDTPIRNKISENTSQKLIKESYLLFETQDLEKTYTNIIGFIRQNGGFLQDDNSNKSYNRVSRQLTVRLPSAVFQKTIDSISNYVSFFDTKRITSRDVTEEFIDLEARLKVKLTLEKRYLELLSKAKNLKRNFRYRARAFKN